MLINGQIRWSIGWALLGMLAFSIGCQDKPPATSPSKIESSSPTSSNKSTTKRRTPQIDPAAVAEDGTILLTPPTQATAEVREPRMDVIVEPPPPIPADAKFGTPTLADMPPRATSSGEPTLADPQPEPRVEALQVAVVSDAAEVKLPEDVASAQENSAVGTLASAEELDQKIGEGWPNPQAVLLLTGQQHGYLEPCGCTGLDRQKGGIIRRHTLITQLIDRGWPVVPLDVGNQVRRTGRQAEIQFRVTASAFKALDYKAVTLGIDDLFLNSAGLVQVAASDDVVKNPGIFISANTTIYDPSFWPKARIIEAGGRKIGVTAYMGEEFKGDLQANKDITVDDPITSLRSAVDDLKQQGCDYLVLLAHANQQDSERVAAKVPGFDLVVTSGGHGEPRNVLDPIPGSTAMISQVGTKGMYACLIGLFDDAKTPVRYQRIAISSQFKDSPRMLEAFKQYQEQLQSEGFEGLGVKPKSPPRAGQFVGSDSCGGCHSNAFEIWKDSRHFHATYSIITPPNDRGAIARHFDPECLSCHVTGWDPQGFVPFESGYWSLEKTPKLTGSGCENCHGPGSDHVNAENGDVEADEELLTKLREQMRLPLDEAVHKCHECHDTDNSPDFNFENYWEEVKHYGKD